MNLTLLYAIISFAGSVLSVLILLPLFISYSRKRKLIDSPNERASHTIPTPTSGGITFIAAILVSILSFQLSNELLIVAGTLIGIGIMGFLDDRLDLNALLKLAVEGAIVLLIYSIGINTHALESILGFGQLPLALSFLLTFIVIAGLINAFNLIDGIDGLAGGISLINTLCFSWIFWQHSDTGFLLLHLCLSGALIVFLYYNFNPAKIFMGDAGSLIIGLLMGISFLRVLSFENDLTSTWAFCMMLFPSIDMLRLFVARILQKRSPFSADRNHYHHLLLKTGNNHKQAAIACYTIHIVLLLFGMLLLKQLSFIQTNLIMLCSSIIVYSLIELRFVRIQKEQKKNVAQFLSKKLDYNRLFQRLQRNRNKTHSIYYFTDSGKILHVQLDGTVSYLYDYDDLRTMTISNYPDVLLYYSEQRYMDKTIQFLAFLKSINAPVPVIILSDNSDQSTAVSCIREGAVDYIDLREQHAKEHLSESVAELLDYQDRLYELHEHTSKGINHFKVMLYILLFVIISFITTYYFVET